MLVSNLSQRHLIIPKQVSLIGCVNQRCVLETQTPFLPLIRGTGQENSFVPLLSMSDSFFKLKIYCPKKRPITPLLFYVLLLIRILLILYE